MLSVFRRDFLQPPLRQGPHGHRRSKGITVCGENQINLTAFSEMSIKQFDKLFEQLLARHNENKIYWKSLEADLLKSVTKLENHREQGTLFDQLEVQLESCIYKFQPTDSEFFLYSE